MSIIYRIDNHALMELVREMLSRGQKVLVTVTGGSMYPFLRSEIDRVELVDRPYGKIKKGDIVLIQREDGDYILHRVIRKTDSDFYIVGDAQVEEEGPLNPSQLIASVSGTKRRDSYVDMESKTYRYMVLLWMKLRKHRVFILDLYTSINKIKKLRVLLKINKHR